MSASSKHDARPRLVCTTSMATTTNWAQLVVATIALGLRCSNHRFRSLHQFFNYPLDLLPTLDAIVANKKFSSGFPSLKNVMSSWCWPADRILGLGEEVIQVVQVSLICFFFTFLNLLVFLLFFPPWSLRNMDSVESVHPGGVWWEWTRCPVKCAMWPEPRRLNVFPLQAMGIMFHTKNHDFERKDFH